MRFLLPLLLIACTAPSSDGDDNTGEQVADNRPTVIDVPISELDCTATRPVLATFDALPSGISILVCSEDNDVCGGSFTDWQIQGVQLITGDSICDYDGSTHVLISYW